MAATLVASLSAFGESVSGDDARNAVTGWVRLREALGDEIVAEPESVATYQGQDGKGEFHVVSLKGGGYVITSGDTSITPILGYSKTGTFDADENSPQWALLTADVAARAAELEAPAGSASAGGANTAAVVQLQHEEPGGNHDKWARLVSASKRGGRLLSAKLTSPPADLRVASFIRSKWGQQDAKSGNGYSHYYYSYYTPYNWPCGCVATAQAQIMRYFEWPKTSVEARTFTCATNDVAVSLTMKGGTYDWTHMPYNPIEVPYDWNNVIGIAKLTYDVGVTVEMSYKSTGSGSFIGRVVGSLIGTFGYSNAVFDYSNNGLGEEDCKKAIIPNLDARIPVVLGIRSTANTGHAVLADGYGYYNDELYVHMNMGWKGSEDYWYTPAVINTSDRTYNIVGATFNISTNAPRNSVIASGRVLDQDGGAISGATVTLRSGTVEYSTATSDEHGVYAFIIPPTSSPNSSAIYVVDAVHAEYTSTGTKAFIASQTTSDTISGSTVAYTGKNTNSYGNDVMMEAKNLPKLATPESATATEFETSASVTLTCATDGAAIYYTLDGSTPNESSALYTGPIVLTRTTTVKARAILTGYARSDVFTRTFVSAGAIDEFYFRHDFSGGTKAFVAGEGTNFTRDQVNSTDANAKAVNGPDGPWTAHHPSNVWGQFEQPTVLHGAWSAAMSLCMDATETGVLLSLGRLNQENQKEVALLSSSTKSNLYFKVMTTDSNKAKSVENTFTVTTTNDLTEGFHSLVLVYTPASELLNGAGTFDIYCDGALAGSYSTATTKLLGGSVGGMQYCSLMSAKDDLASLGVVSSQMNDDVAFYDFRFYDRALTASEAAKYAAAYPPMAVPVQELNLVNAYAQSGSENLLMHLDAIDNAGAGVHETSPETWADLTGNHTVTCVNSPSFSGDAFVADKSSYFATASDAVKTALSGSTKFTLELVISHPEQTAKEIYENWVYVGTGGSYRTLIVDIRTKNSENPLVQGVQYRMKAWDKKAQFRSEAAFFRSGITEWNKRQYITVVCDGTSATTYCNGKDKVHSVTSDSITPNSNAVYIGANNGGNPLWSGAEICAVRMTNRVLTEDERMRNYFIDSQRFDLDAPEGYRLGNGIIQVCLVYGADGFEFSTDGGKTWSAGEVWAEINKQVTLSARVATSPTLVVSFSNLPSGATVDGNSATFTPAKPCEIAVSASQWSDNDGTGSFDSAANWTGGVPSSGDFTVKISGDTTISVDGTYSLGAMTVEGFGNVTFSGSGSISATMLNVASGLTVDTCGKLAVPGFSGAGNVVLTPASDTLTLSEASTLTGDLTVRTDTNTAFNVNAATSVRRFYVDAETNAVVTLTVGSGGSFKATSEAIVQYGVLKQGSATALGTTPKITVQDGGTFDINAKAIRQETPIYIAGAGAGDWPWALASSSGSMASGNYLYDLYLTADATVGAGQFKLGRSDANSFIYLNGHTLTAKSWLTLRNINTMAGTIDLQAGASFNTYNNLNKQKSYRGTTLIVHEGFNYNNQTDREVYISYLKMYGGTIGYGSNARDFGVWNELHGYGTIKRLVMGSGAKYHPDGMHYLTVTEKLGGAVVVDLSGIDIDSTKRIRLLKVPATLRETADSALEVEPPKGWRLQTYAVADDVCYDLRKDEFTITIR